MRHRIRETAEVDYQVVHPNGQWWEHRVREIASAGLMAYLQPESVIDPACGDGSLVFALHALHPLRRVTFADISTPAVEHVRKKANEVGLAAAGTSVCDAALRLELAVDTGETWDLVVLTEFLEHIPDPDRVLRLARMVGKRLIASSPLIEELDWDRRNPEHLWEFDNQGYLDMLSEAGWTPAICQNLMLSKGYYNFQIWVCE